MKKNYRNFIPYDELERHRNNVKKIKLIITIFIILITSILIIITRNIQANIETSEESASIAIMQSQIEEDKERKQEKQKKAQKQEQEKIKKEKELKTSKLPKLTEKGRENMESIYHSETKRAFLTFDDGPSSITPQILDTLNNEDVKATFFMLGSNVENFPETTKRVYEEGHYIANHGYTHEYSSIYSSTQAVLDEYNRCNDAVKKALGEPEYNSHLFRFPGRNAWR